MGNVKTFGLLKSYMTVFILFEDTVNHWGSWWQKIGISTLMTLKFSDPNLELSLEYWVRFQLLNNFFIRLLLNLRLKVSPRRSGWNQHFLSDIEWFQKSLWIFDRTFIKKIVDSFQNIFLSTSILFGWIEIVRCKEFLYRWLLAHFEDFVLIVVLM